MWYILSFFYLMSSDLLGILFLPDYLRNHFQYLQPQILYSKHKQTLSAIFEEYCCKSYKMCGYINDLSQVCSDGDIMFAPATYRRINNIYINVYRC